MNRVTLVYVPKAPFGQNLSYDAHAVYTTTKLARRHPRTPDDLIGLPLHGA